VVNDEGYLRAEREREAPEDPPKDFVCGHDGETRTEPALEVGFLVERCAACGAIVDRRRPTKEEP
jgi:hypothetical protein